MGDHLISIHFVFFQFGYNWQKYQANFPILLFIWSFKKKQTQVTNETSHAFINEETV